MKAWLNIYDPNDHATFGKGIGKYNAVVLDLPIHISRSRYRGGHSPRKYCAHPAVAALVGSAVFGPTRKSKATVSR